MIVTRIVQSMKELAITRCSCERKQRRKKRRGGSATSEWHLEPHRRFAGLGDWKSNLRIPSRRKARLTSTTKKSQWKMRRPFTVGALPSWNMNVYFNHSVSRQQLQQRWDFADLIQVSLVASYTSRPATDWTVRSVAVQLRLHSTSSRRKISRRKTVRM